MFIDRLLYIEMRKYVFGPVPSRRLGKSLGVNNIPAKICSYSCVYCQLGRTIRYSIERDEYYDPKEVADEIIKCVESCGKRKIRVVTFVPDGEPTLDKNLGKIIKMIKNKIDKKIAIISNSSLIYRDDVVNDLLEADIVSLKVDAVDEDIFRKVNRPHPKINLYDILDGIARFRRLFKGKLYTESMMIDGLNDSKDHLDGLIKFIRKVKPNKAFIAVPTRPPAEYWVKPSKPEKLVYIHEKLSRIMPNRVELLNYIEKGEFGFGREDAVEELVNIVSVHPMRLKEVYRYFEKRGLDPEKTVRILEKMGDIIILEYNNEKYVIKKLLTRRICSHT